MPDGNGRHPYKFARRADREEECMESIIRAHEDRDGELLRYMFHTEQRELWIWASEPATIS